MRDGRRGQGQGQRHKIDMVLMIAIMATMSGYMGFRAIGDFAIRYRKELLAYLKPGKERLPSYSSVRRVLMSVDNESLSEIFEGWVRRYMAPVGSEWVSVDGKSIRGTKQTEEDRKLAHMVSFFRNDSKEVLMARQTATKSNEIPLVQQMLTEFPLEGVVLTLDAMHCQEETLKKIKAGGNDYVVQVKDNQKN